MLIRRIWAPAIHREWLSSEMERYNIQTANILPKPSRLGVSLAFTYKMPTLRLTCIGWLLWQWCWLAHQRSYLGIYFNEGLNEQNLPFFKTKLYAKNYHISATLGGMIDNRLFVAFNCQRRIFRALIVAMMGAINSLMVEIIWTSDGNTFLVFSSNVRKHKIRIRIFRLMDFFSEKNIVGPHGFPDPPSLAQMTFTQCTSMSELKIDPGAPPGGQI